MTKCIDCQGWLKDYGKDVWCYQCPEHPEKEPVTWANVEMVHIKGYGRELKSRVREMERRVILPVEPTKADKDAQVDYYVGRRCENGKIAEREPDY